MKQIFALLFIALLIVCDLNAKPKIINGRKYLIGNLGAADEGGCGIGNDTYNIAYYSDVDPETADESYFWLIKEESTGQYSIKNASNGKYIRYNTTKNDREALELVENLESDQSTLFTLTLTGKSNSHYMITSVVNQSKGWNKRNSAYDGIYPVGMYSASTGDNNNNFVFSDADGNRVEDDGKIPITLPTATQTLGTVLSSYLSSLTFSDKVPVINASAKELFLSIMPEQMGNNNEFTINFTWKNSGYKIYIANRLITSGMNFTFTNVTGDSNTAFEIRDNSNTKVYTGSIKFTCHPIVQLYSDGSITSTYNLGRIVVTEPHKSIPAEIMLSNIRVRGATSSGFPKKAYAIKLKAEDGQEPAYRSYLGLREDNNWILDAMWIDPARARNRVTTDLWVDFSNKPYYFDKEPKLINGTRGTFVEVFLNDSYNGLYTMTEKVDRKQLNLKKFIPETDSTTLTHRGGLYKSTSWSVSTLLGNLNYNRKGIPNFNNNSETWDSYEVKYPDFGDGEPINWSPIYNAVVMSSSTTEDYDFYREISKYYDIPVFRDYYLLLDLILATDNHGKNLYFSVYDQTVSPKITITPWDMDGTWGRRWEGSTGRTGPNQSFESFIAANEPMQNNLYIRLRELNVDNWNLQLADRYRELRGNYFKYENLIARFENKMSEIQLSDAISREYYRWGISEIYTEMDFLKDWIKKRLTYLDIQYLGGPYVEVPNGTEETTTNKIYASPNPAKDKIRLMQLTPKTPISIVDMQGKEVLKATASDETMILDISTLSSGIYILKNGLSVAKIIKQ